MSWQRELRYEPSNTIDTLRRKYKRLALQRHPNKGGTKADFQRLQAAWENAQQALSARAAASVAFPSRQPSRQSSGFTSIFRQPSTSTVPARRAGLYSGRRARQPNVQYNTATPMNWEPTPMDWQRTPTMPRRSSAASQRRGVGKRRAAPRRQQARRSSPEPRRQSSRPSIFRRR